MAFPSHWSPRWSMKPNPRWIGLKLLVPTYQLSARIAERQIPRQPNAQQGFLIEYPVLDLDLTAQPLALLAATPALSA
jgi:hypothetical protein